MAIQNTTQSRVFLIGPCCVGKTTVGPLLALLIGATFVDLDAQFCERVAPIRRFLDHRGYPAYVRENASLFQTLLQESTRNARTVFALSSGFLVADVEPEIVEQNRALVAQQGTAILLLPSEDPAQCVEMIVKRQLQRGLGLERESQTALAYERILPYSELGRIRVYHSGSPQQVADEVAHRLKYRWFSQSATDR